jgi:AcrR family transcriptional regulator
MAQTKRSARPSAKPKVSWQRRAEARPDEILDAALDAFIENGFEAARIEDVASRAGLSKGAIYLYFEGKEALLRALIERELTPLIGRLSALAEAETEDPKAVVRTILEGMAGVLGNPRVFAVPRLVITVAARFPEIRDHYRHAVIEPGRAALESLIRRGIALGQFRDVDPVAASRAIIGPVLFEAFITHVFAGRSALGDPEGFVRAQMDVLMTGLAVEAR